ncbi:Fluoride export protein 1 [Colletotrichum sp. SAR 10_70]|nr:Fluoride export protein 1 [Colletotrichum sp. SAR 10_71]KAI8191278.1 Fluoride export protein 1 [Colletotrichum sp. SAR 10_70]
MSRRMENGNHHETARPHDAERGPGQLYNVEEGEEVNPERRGTFGRPLLTGTTSDADARDEDVEYDAPAGYGNLDELVADPVGHSPSGSRAGKPSLEQIRSGERRTTDIEMQDSHAAPNGSAETSPTLSEDKPVKKHVSKLATEIYTVSYLVFFAILGTLARLGLQALTTYPDAPVSFGVLWANVGGSLVMGFLAEDRKLFRHEWGTPTYDEQIRKARRERDAGGNAVSVDLAAAKKAHLATKKTIPLYIGLATGFCGSFTSFSSFIRDVFLAMSNDLPGAGGVSPVPRNGGYSFMAMMAVIISTVGLSLCGLFVGAHLGAALEPITPSISYSLGRKVFDRVAVVLGFGCWIGAVLMSIWPPHDAWRGQALFSLVFAPLGCLGRFYVSMLLNSRIPAFPLGTFAVNISGVAVLGMCWDLGHAELGGLVGCQVLQGIEDGFCGCLTTVSTWVAELSALRRRHAYTYGMTSVVAGFAIMVIIMGGMRWSDGFGPLMCTH